MFVKSILRISSYLVRMWENTDQEKLRIWTLFTQWWFYEKRKNMSGYDSSLKLDIKLVCLLVAEESTIRIQWNQNNDLSKDYQVPWHEKLPHVSEKDKLFERNIIQMAYCILLSLKYNPKKEVKKIPFIIKHRNNIDNYNSILYQKFFEERKSEVFELGHDLHIFAFCPRW